MPLVDTATHFERDDNPENCGIEITPEMVDAGEDVLLTTLGGGVSVHWWPDELAKKVYRVMAMRSPERAKGELSTRTRSDKDSSRGTT